MSNRRMLVRMTMIACFMLPVALQAAPKGTSPWRMKVEPALRDGVPYAELVTSGPAEALLVETVQLDGRGTSIPETLTSSTLPAATSFKLTLPSVDKDTYFEVVATTTTLEATTATAEVEDDTAEEEEKPLLVWRALARPRDKKLIDYRGRSEMLPPADFDQYWSRAKKQLAAVPMDVKVTRVPDRDTSTGLLHRVELASVQSTRIVCWYYVPREAFDGAGEKAVRKFPAMVIAPGYGAEEPPIDRTKDGFITLSVNPRNHGPSKEFWKAPVEHLLYNLSDPENYYYKLAYLDCLRATQFLFGREEVDTKRVATEGGSQGGLFALAMAALEPRIACVCSNVTAFSDYPDSMVLATSGHHKQFRELLADADTTAAERIRLSLAYTDGANMATRIKCPVQINMGGLDPVCPYVGGVVIHNRLPKGVAREINMAPAARHEVPPSMREDNKRWYNRWLKP